MALLIFTEVFLIAVSVVLYIVIRALPRIEEASGEAAHRSRLSEYWVNSRIPERVDILINNFLFKFLRRAKVSIMKLDNSLSGHLAKIKREERKDKGIDFKEIAGQNSEGDRDSGGSRE